jgi:hypothetical protein
MTTTVSIPCPAGTWTQVSTGSANVTVQGPSFAYRLAVGTSAPTPPNSGLFISEADGMFALSGLAGTDNVYIYPIGTLPLAVQVLAS